MKALTSDDLTRLFVSPRAHSEFLDFFESDLIIKNSAIQSRTIATDFTLQHSSVDNYATLQGSAPYKIMRNIVASLNKKGLLPEVKGIGLEIGAGVGLFGISMVQEFEDKIKGVISIEATKPFVLTGIDKAASEILGNKYFKIYPCFGTFEKIMIQENSVDFVLQFEALHHAEDLLIAIKETARVLKPGGLLISIDRSWVDQVSDQVLEELMNHEYEIDWLKAKGFPQDNKFSRRDNGEHEYRDSFWSKSFSEAGLKKEKFVPLQPKIGSHQIIKRVLGMIKMNKLLKIKIPSRSGIIRGKFSSLARLNPEKIGGVVEFEHPRPLVLNVWRK